MSVAEVEHVCVKVIEEVVEGESVTVVSFLLKDAGIVSDSEELGRSAEFELEFEVDTADECVLPAAVSERNKVSVVEWLSEEEHVIDRVADTPIVCEAVSLLLLTTAERVAFAVFENVGETIGEIVTLPIKDSDGEPVGCGCDAVSFAVTDNPVSVPVDVVEVAAEQVGVCVLVLVGGGVRVTVRETLMVAECVTLRG